MKSGFLIVAVVGVLALMGYGVYEASAGSGTEAHASFEGRRAAEGTGVGVAAEFSGRGPGQGQGAGRSSGDAGSASGQTGGWGRSSGPVPAEPDRDRDQAWTDLSGAVVSLDGSELAVQTAQGEQVTAGLGKPSFWGGQGITLLPGDEVELTGFWEDGEFEVGSLTLVATGQTVVLRAESGRPMWAGGGRWAGPAAVDPAQSF